MNQEEIFVFATMIPLGLLGLGLWAYMYDQLQNVIPQKKFKALDIISRFLFPILPVLFLKKSIRDRSLKGMIVFCVILFGSLFVDVHCL